MRPFDHAVIYCGDQLDSLAGTFRRLGFFVTPRGDHSLGSSNYLIIFRSNYLELLGFPAGGPQSRSELANARPGLNGLVFRSQDAQRDHEQLLASGVLVTDVQSFSRPVDLGQGEPPASWPLARFRTVRAQPGWCPAGRVYFCEHLTPELVWRDAWQSHLNTALDLVGAQLTCSDLALQRDRWSRLLGEAAVADQAGGLLVSAPPVSIRLEAADADRMVGLTLRVASLDALAHLLSLDGIAFEQSAGALQVAPADAGGVALRFIV